MMMNSCITCFVLLLTISLTHASGGVASLGGARGNVGVQLIGGSGITASLTGSGASQSITLSFSAYLRLIYYVSALEKVCYNGILGGWLPRGLLGGLGSGFAGQLGGGIAGQFGRIGGLGVIGNAGGLTGSLGGGISGRFGSAFAGRASGFGSSSLSGSLQGSLRAGLGGRAMGKGAAY